MGSLYADLMNMDNDDWDPVTEGIEANEEAPRFRNLGESERVVLADTPIRRLVARKYARGLRAGVA
jgi:hypothetical protein